MTFTAARKEDEVPDTNDGPAGTTTDTAEVKNGAAQPLPGFADAMLGWSPPESSQGEPEQATAVETSEDDKAPTTEPEKPAAKAEEPAKVEAKPESAPTVNFDGFSDESKTYWENALKAGHATPVDVERARKESLFQASWTRNHQKLAKEREAFEADKKRMADDVALLEKIRADDRLHAIWLKMSKGEIAAEESGGEDLVDKKTAAQIAREEARKVAEEREAEKADRSAKEQRAYDARYEEYKAAASERMRILGVTPEVMRGYLAEEEKALNGADPVLTVSPEEFMSRVERRHEKASMEAKIADLQAQLGQRASKQVQTSKQSLPPSRRTTGPSLTGMSKVLADMGVARLSDIPGLGFSDG